MPVSRARKRRMSAEAASYVAPPSISVPSLLRGGNDRTFQKLVFDFFTISARIERVRVHLASRMGISGPPVPWRRSRVTRGSALGQLQSICM